MVKLGKKERLGSVSLTSSVIIFLVFIISWLILFFLVIKFIIKCRKLNKEIICLKLNKKEQYQKKSVKTLDNSAYFEPSNENSKKNQPLSNEYINGLLEI